MFETERKCRGESLKKCCSSPDWMTWKHVLENFLNSNCLSSPSLIAKVFDKGVYAVETARKNMKAIPEMAFDKTLKSKDHEFSSSKKMGCCKWFDNFSVILKEWLPTTSAVLWHQKVSLLKVQLSCQVLSKCTTKQWVYASSSIYFLCYHSSPLGHSWSLSNR